MRRMFKLFVSTVVALAALAAVFLYTTRSPSQANAVYKPFHRLEQNNRLQGVDITINEIVAQGFDRPVHVTHAGDGTGRLFVVEQPGRVKRFHDGATTLFLDITDRVLCCGERGLFSVAFPPGYAGQGHFYVNYTRKPDGATVVARYRVTSDPDVADPDSEQAVLIIPQPYVNHNGGQLSFGRTDGYLYIGTGDGGSAGDPQNRAQNPASLLGKMLRIDVETGSPLTYTVPSSNPYTQTAGYRGEIWALGLRNPWRFSFDRQTGDLYIGDVGQNAWEEIDFLPAAAPGGANFGWRCLEGTHTYNTSSPCDDPAFLAGLTDPLAEYSHSEGQSVTGGFVYRGFDFPALTGRYFFADFSQGKIWSMNASTGALPELELDTGLAFSSFGQDEGGELYVVDYGGGRIRRVADANGARPDLSSSTKMASAASADPGEVVTYTIRLVNTGGPNGATFHLTDILPSSLVYVSGSLEATHGVVDDSQSPTLRWQGSLAGTKTVTVTYLVIPTGQLGSWVNQAQVTGPAIEPIVLTHALFVPRSVLTTVFLPLVLR